MKVALLISGGVDSSVALAILKEQGYNVHAFYLKIWLEDELSYLGECPWEEDLSYATSVCTQLNVPLHVVSLQKEYHARVVAYTIDAVKQGLTPNPDMLCNREVKFGAFMDWLAREGYAYDKIATGHYAQVETDTRGSVKLLCAPDPIKDQTYFLAMMYAGQLERVLFPIGHLMKKDVRAKALEFQLPTATRKDSQGICFLGKISFVDFVRHHLGVQKGRFIEKESGDYLGEHDGFYFYTIGQRRGITVNNGPWYVCSKNAKQNIVYLTHGFSGKDQSIREFMVSGINWITEIQEDIPICVKLRHGPERKDCTVSVCTGTCVMVRLAYGDKAVTPGQYAVFYQDNVCLGGGVIAVETSRV